MKAKRPVITIAAVDVKCPDCGEFIASPDGPLYFEIAQLRTGEEHACECGTVVVIPPMKSVKLK